MCDKSQEKFVIQSIVTFSRTRNRFLVSWEGYPPSSNTWEPFECFNDKNCPLKFLAKLKSLNVVCSKCVGVAKSSAPPGAAVYCSCIKRSPSPVGKPGKRALDAMKQDNAEDSAGAVVAPRNVTLVATRNIRTGRFQSKAGDADEVDSKERRRVNAAGRMLRARDQAAAEVSVRSKQSPLSVHVKRTSSRFASPPRRMSPRRAASGVTVLPTQRQLRVLSAQVASQAAHSIAPNLPSPLPRRMSPRRAASGSVRVLTSNNVVNTVKDVLDVEVRQEKGQNARRWYFVSWLPSGSRPDSWIDCEDMPKELVIMFERKHPQHAASIDAEIKRRRGGRPPRPKAESPFALSENISKGRQNTIYEPENPKKKAYTRCCSIAATPIVYLHFAGTKCGGQEWEQNGGDIAKCAVTG